MIRIAQVRLFRFQAIHRQRTDTIPVCLVIRIKQFVFTGSKSRIESPETGRCQPVSGRIRRIQIIDIIGSVGSRFKKQFAVAPKRGGNIYGSGCQHFTPCTGLRIQLQQTYTGSGYGYGSNRSIIIVG